MPELDAESLFCFTVRMPPETVSPVVRAVSALVPSFRFHVIVRPVEPSGMLL